MNDKRHAMRISFVANCLLTNEDYQLPCRVENISLNGALVRVDSLKGKKIHPDDTFDMILDNGSKESSVKIPVQVVHHAYSYIGLKFIHMNQEIEDSIIKFMDILYINKISELNTSKLHQNLRKYLED
jgi:c-di-GMP-binding flagellar brake protein YcgR